MESWFKGPRHKRAVVVPTSGDAQPEDFNAAHEVGCVCRAAGKSGHPLSSFIFLRKLQSKKVKRKNTKHNNTTKTQRTTQDYKNLQTIFKR